MYPAKCCTLSINSSCKDLELGRELFCASTPSIPSNACKCSGFPTKKVYPWLDQLDELKRRGCDLAAYAINDDYCKYCQWRPKPCEPPTRERLNCIECCDTKKNSKAMDRFTDRMEKKLQKQWGHWPQVYRNKPIFRDKKMRLEPRKSNSTLLASEKLLENGLNRKFFYGQSDYQIDTNDA